MKKIVYLAKRIECFIAQHNDEILWCLEKLPDMYDLVLYIYNSLFY